LFRFFLLRFVIVVGYANFSFHLFFIIFNRQNDNYKITHICKEVEIRTLITVSDVIISIKKISIEKEFVNFMVATFYFHNLLFINLEFS
jgi:hypothetical protein